MSKNAGIELKIVRTNALAVRRCYHSAESRSIILKVRNVLNVFANFKFLKLQWDNGCPAHLGTIIYEAARVLAAQYKLDKAGPAIPDVSQAQIFSCTKHAKMLRKILSYHLNWGSRVDSFDPQ